MNIDAYDLDSLRKIVRDLQAENRSLRKLLSENHIYAETSDVFSDSTRGTDAYDPDQASLVEPFDITNEVANRFFSMFWGRIDVFARRGEKGGLFPPV